MMGIGSSPGAPRSSIMFLMSIERSATLRSAGDVSKVLRISRMDGRLTSDNLHVVAGDQLDILFALGRHGGGRMCVCWWLECMFEKIVGG